jgi:hypothetical protein
MKNFILIYRCIKLELIRININSNENQIFLFRMKVPIRLLDMLNKPVINFSVVVVDWIVLKLSFNCESAFFRGKHVHI